MSTQINLKIIGIFVQIMEKILRIKTVVVLLFTILISAKENMIRREEKFDAINAYISRVLNNNEHRSLILLLTDYEPPPNLLTTLYKSNQPIYNIYLHNVGQFNGLFDNHYDNQITIEESKIYIGILGSLLEFSDFLPLLQRVYFWRARDRLMVVIFNEGYDIFSHLTESFILCWKFKMINVAFVLVGDAIRTFTYDPFTQNNSLILDDNIFPEKIINLMGFKLNISLFPNILDAIPTKKGYKGRDGVMAKTLMQYINATYTFIAPNDGVDYGENHNRINLTGAFADVAKEKTWLALNSRYFKDEFQNFVEATYPHGRDDLTCLVPIVRTKDIKQFFSNFSISLWIPFGIFTLVFTIFVATVKYYEIGKIDLPRILITTLGINLGQSSDNFYGIGTLKVTVLLYIYLSLSLNLAYQSGMTSLFTVPIKPKQINALSDLASSDLKIYTLVRFKRMMNRSLSAKLTNKIIPKVVTIEEEDQIKYINEHKHFAVVCKNHIAAYAVMQGENYRDGCQYYRIMKEKPMPSIVCYIVRYGSPFLNRLNVLIERLIQSGINEHWRKTTLHEMAIRGNIHQESGLSTITKLTLTNLMTIFWFILFGWTLSGVAFGMEILYYKYWDKIKSCNKI